MRDRDRSPGEAFPYRLPPVPLSELRDVAGTARAGEADSDGYGVSPPMSPGDFPTPAFRARITAGGPGAIYSFHEWGLTADGTAYEIVPNGFSGTLNALERNGNTGVPAGATSGALVMMRSAGGPGGTTYDFSYSGTGIFSADSTTSYEGDTFNFSDVSFVIDASQTLTIEGPGTLVIEAPVVYPPFSFSISNGVNSNVNLTSVTGSVIRLTGPTATWSITGFQLTGLTAGHSFTLLNATGYTGTITHDATSTASFRIYNPASTDLTVPDGASFSISYDGTSSRWKLASASPAVSSLTTKGDLYAYGTAPARLAAGTNGYVLSANSAQATGLEWIAAASTAKYEAYYRYDSTAGTKCWYPGGEIRGEAASGSMAGDIVYYLPFVSAKGHTADRLAVDVTTGSGGAKARVGIYTNAGDTTPYPVTLLVDSGELDCSATGLVSATISQALSANTLYWLAITSNGTLDVRCCVYNKGFLWNILGHGESGGALAAGGGVGWSESRSFAALPATATPATRLEPTAGGSAPLPWLRIS